MAYNRIKPDLEQAILADWKVGRMGAPAIAKRHGVSTQTAARVAQRNGVDRGKVKADLEKRITDGALDEEIVALYLAGSPIPEIKAQTGVSVYVIRKRVREREGQIRSRGATKTVLTAEQWEHVVSRRSEGASQETIAEEIGIGQPIISRELIRRGMRTRPRYSRGPILTHNGYIRVPIESDDPRYGMADSSERVLEHRLVMARAIGRDLFPFETVHHINGHPGDNRLENLQLRTSDHGQGAAFCCNACGSHDVSAVPLAEP